MPWLAGPLSQGLASGGKWELTDGDWLLRTGETLAGVLLGTAGAAMEEEAHRLYQRLFAHTRGLNRYRIWNYVPLINAAVAGEENYMAFNSGRYRAYAAEFGGICHSDFSAASAVGVKGGPLALAFVAGPSQVEHFENPLQTPASLYPARYGKNAPLFARGSRIMGASGPECWHLSGTASIRSSETTGGNDFARQLETTLENIDSMLAVMEVPASRQAAWKIFLRDRKHLEWCRQRLGEVYPSELERMMFLEADICRSDLLVEIEAIFQPLLPPATTLPPAP